GVNQERLQKVAFETDKLLEFKPTHLDQGVGTISVKLPTPWTRSNLETFLQNILWEHDAKIENDYQVWRLKGLVYVQGEESEALMVQGVNNTYDINPVASSESGDDRNSRIVLIGQKPNDYLVNG